MKLADKILKDQFLRRNLIFFVGSMLVAVLNYLYHPILGRMLSIEDFGEVQALISLFLQFGVVFGVFSMLTINIACNTEDKNQKALAIIKMQKIAYLLVFINFVLIILFKDKITHALSFDSFYPFVSLALIYLFSVSFTFRKAYLQGVEDFNAVSLSGIIFSGGRLLFAVALVMIGWRSFGAITGLLIAQIVSFFYVYWKTKDDFKLESESKPAGFDKAYIKQELYYAMLVLAANGFITFLYTADVVMVKYWFTPSEAGLYSGVATIARIIFFATGSVAGVMLPAIKMKNSDSENFRMFKKSFWLVAFVGGSGTLIFSIFPDLIIRLMIGASYLPYAHFLARLSFLLFLASIVNLLFNYLMALRRFALIPISIIGMIAIFAYLAIFGHSIESIINAYIFGAITVFLSFGLEQFRKKLQNHNNQ
jgi:O-antigen/teichoic acid export membrane protein